jgi:uncharacterized protein (TIGR03435 family)
MLAQQLFRSGAAKAILPEFEVATMKPSDPNGRAPLGVFTYPGGTVKVTGMTVKDLLALVLGVQTNQIDGGPTWIGTAHYDIVGKPPASSLSSKANPPSVKTQPNTEQLQMLEALLIDRLHLEFHHLDRESRVYYLVRGDGKLKMSPSKVRDAFPWVGSHLGGVLNGDGMVGTNISMPLMAERLSSVLQYPVVDRTGLTGSFDFDVSYPLGDQKDDITPSLVTSIQELGLKLKPGRGSVDAVVIDRIERPSAN